MAQINTTSIASCPLTVKTSKAWVLPPRPKPGRKPTNGCQNKEKERDKKEKKKTKKEMSQIRLGSTPTKISLTQEQTMSLNGSPGVATEALRSKDSNDVAPITSKSKIALTSQQQHQSYHQQYQQKQDNSKTTVNFLNRNISLIEQENISLKDHLLSLIHDYKHLRHAVLSSTNSANLYSTADQDVEVHTARKRSFTELQHYPDSMNELIDNMNDLSHNSIPPSDSNSVPTRFFDSDDLRSPISTIEEECDMENDKKDMELFNFLNLDLDDEDDEIRVDMDDEDDDDDTTHDSPFLSRTTSPLETDCENSLMTSLTRSTTVSTNNSSFILHEPKKFLPSNSYQQNTQGTFSMFKEQPYKFHNLPSFEEGFAGSGGFSFESLTPNETFNSMLKQDQYNMVTDFLEESLIDNDTNYYVNQARGL